MAVLGLYESLGEIIAAYKQAEAMEHQQPERAYPAVELDSIFNDAVDLPKVKEEIHGIRHLKNVRGREVWRQKMWYVVYRVCLEMDWLVCPKATKFRGWAEAVYGEEGHSTKGDFDAIHRGLKKKRTREWKAYDENMAPYVEVARAMWHIFQGNKGEREVIYLKKNRYIYHSNMPA